MTVTSVRLQPDVARGLERAATRQRRSKSWLINQALREYMEREKQDRERWAQTLEALDEVASGRTVPARSVHAWLRSWGSSKEPVPPRGKR